MHTIAFALMLTDGLLTGINLLRHTQAMAVVSSFVTVMYCICIVVALAKQYGSDIPGTVRRITWASLGFICVSFFLSYILFMLTIPRLMIHRPGAMISQWEMYRAMFDLSAQDSRLVMVVYTFEATCSLLLGALGLVRVKRHRDDLVSLARPNQDSGGEVWV